MIYIILCFLQMMILLLSYWIIPILPNFRLWDKNRYMWRQIPGIQEFIWICELTFYVIVFFIVHKYCIRTKVVVAVYSSYSVLYHLVILLNKIWERYQDFNLFVCGVKFYLTVFVFILFLFFFSLLEILVDHLGTPFRVIAQILLIFNLIFFVQILIIIIFIVEL